MAKMLVFSNAAEGRDDDFNAWYDNVHLPDVRSVPGVTSAERYRVQQPGDEVPEHRYVAVYELDGDPGTVLKEIATRAATGQFQMTDSIDPVSMKTMVWESV